MRPLKNHDGGTLGYCTACGFVKYVESYQWLEIAGERQAVKRCRCTRRDQFKHKPVPPQYVFQEFFYTGPTHIPEAERVSRPTRKG